MKVLFARDSIATSPVFNFIVCKPNETEPVDSDQYSPCGYRDPVLRYLLLKHSLHSNASQIAVINFSDRNKRITVCCNIYNCEPDHNNGTFKHSHTYVCFQTRNVILRIPNIRLLLQWNLTQGDCFPTKGILFETRDQSASICFSDGLSKQRLRGIMVVFGNLRV